MGGMVEVWRHEFSPAPGVQVPVLATTVVAGDAAYIADMGGFVHAHRASDGALLWTKLVSTSAPDPYFFSVFHGAPVLTDHELYVGDSDSNIHQLNRHTGTAGWSVKVDTNSDSLIHGDLATFGPYVIFGVSSFENTTINDLTMRGSVSAVNRWNGDIAWQTYTTSDQSLENPKWGAGVAVWSSPAIDDELLSTQIGGVPDGAGGFVFGNIITALSLSRGRLYVSSVPIVPGAPVGVVVYGLE